MYIKKILAFLNKLWYNYNQLLVPGTNNKYYRIGELVMIRTQIKKERHKKLSSIVNENPFIKDCELAEILNVSVATIRIDRGELGIGEYRERIKNVAKNVSGKIPFDIVDMKLYHDGISVIETDDAITYEGTDIIKGQAMFGIAENLALDIINAKEALIKVANMKYRKEVKKGEKLVAKFEVIRVKDKEYIVWVKIRSKQVEVYRCKFNLVLMESK